MKVNTRKLYEKYKDIQRICICDGELIPSLINSTKIPKKYKLSLEEIYKLNANDDKAIENYAKHISIEYEIIKKRSKEYSTLTEYWLDQLKNFLDNYPQFKVILEE